MTEKEFSIYDLQHKVIVEKGKRIMVCCGHFCDIDGMSEGNYYKNKRERQNLREVKE